MQLRKTISMFLLFTLALALMPALWTDAVAESEYYIDVDITNQYVTVYRTSDDTVVRKMICSTGTNSTPTPLGTYIMPEPWHGNERNPWWWLDSNCYVNYGTRIIGHICFHSVLYSRANYDSVITSSVRKLGQQASHGCVRLRDEDAKWISDNCPPGTVVNIFKSSSRDEYVRNLLLNTGSYTTDTGLTYEQYLGLSDDPNTLDRASTGAQVKELETLLQGLGFFTGTPDETYDTAAIQAVAAFQKAAGLKVTGLADLETCKLAASADAPTGTRTTFKAGMTGRAVEKLQEALAALKLYDGPIDGVYSEELAAAVRVLQEVEVHTADGVADPAIQEIALSMAEPLLEHFGTDGDYQLLELKEEATFALVSCDTYLRLRSGPSTSADVIAQINDGTRVLVLSGGDEWTQVRYDGQTGYCMTAYLNLYTGESVSLYYGQNFFAEGEELRQMQLLMIELGYMDGEATGKYNRETIEAVKAFQEAIGQYPGGLPDAETLSQAQQDSAPTGTQVTLRAGDSGRPVETLQRALQTLRLYDGEIDGVYDAELAQAITLFERYYGYVQNGVAESEVQKDAVVRAKTLNDRFGEGEYDLILLEDRRLVATVTTEALWLRSGPSTSASKEYTMPMGTRLNVLAELGEWTQVDHNGTVGYVMSQYISVSEEYEYDVFYDVDPVSEAQVEDLQKALIELGYLTGEATGVYDTATFEAVKAFEEALGDAYADGLANQDVLNAALEEDAPVSTGLTLTENTSATRAVKALQRSLRALGYYDGEIDGRYTGEVSQAVRMYQLANRESIDGVADQATQDAIHAAAEAVRAEYGEDYVTILSEDSVRVATVTTELLWLRAEPSTNAKKLGGLEEGTELPVLETLNGWVKVRYEGQDGYVMAQYVALTNETIYAPQYTNELPGGADALKELQRNLIWLGYLDGSATGIYNTATIEAIRAFQEAVHLEANGEANEATLEASRREDAPAGTRVTLREGAQGKAVQALQEALQALNFYAGDNDGIYDEEVAAAVKLFQRFYRSEGYAANGEASPQVQRAALEKAANNEPGYNGEDMPEIVLKAEVVNTSYLRLRAAASTDAAVYAQINRGEAVTVLEWGDTWSKVQYGNYTGYAMSAYLRAYEEEVLDEGVTTDLRAVVNIESLWLRMSNSTSSKQLAKMYAGEIVMVLEKGEVWSRVQYGGQMGYAMSEYLVFYNAGADDAEQEPVATATAVNCNYLRLREAPSASARELAKMYPGEKISVLEIGDIWSKVQYGNYTGYAMTQYLDFDGDEPEQPVPVATAMVVNCSYLRLRESASTSARELAKMYAGEKISVLEIGDTWSKVFYNGISGYAMTEFLQFPDA